MDEVYAAYVSRLETLRKTAADGSEYWLARELQPLLSYNTWQNFESVIERAKLASSGAGVNPSKHFAETTKLFTVGNGAVVQRVDWFLSRYACYLIAMNADSAKAEVGHAQTYFALQTRKAEAHQALTEAQQRFALRDRVRSANKNLNAAAQGAGVTRFGIFNDAGYQGLYGGLGLKAIKAQKGLTESDDLMDRAGRLELAANEFRATQAEDKIVRENIQGEQKAVQAHRKVGEHVRQTIKDLGGTMPEELPAEPSIKRLAKEARNPSLLSGSDDSSEP